MAINVLQYNQLIKSVNAKSDQIATQRRIRDSADSATGTLPQQITALADSIANYDSLIDSAQQYVANFGGDLSLLGLCDCHFMFYSSPVECVCTWQYIVDLCDYTGYSSVGCLCLDGVTTNCCHGQCGFNCNWTVPAGTNRVQFEIWGPGASTTWGSCCAFSPNGTTGAYLSQIICVSPGDTFCLVSGCAICCYAKGCEGGYPASNIGTHSAVYGCTSATGSNVCMCMCAMSGYSSLACEMVERDGCCGAWIQGYCKGYWNSGNCLCTDGHWMCFDNSRGMFGREGHQGQGGYCQCTMPYMPSRCTVAYTNINTGSWNDIRVPNTCFTVPGILSKGFFSNDNYGNMCSQGTPKFPCIQCYCFTSETCWGGQSCQNCCGHRRSPGSGGMGNHAMGGGTAWCGDIGRGGAVYLRWGCI